MTFLFLGTNQQNQIIEAEWPEEFSDGYRTALGLVQEQRELGGYPIGFNKWDKSRKHAWYKGWNTASKDLTDPFICYSEKSHGWA
jgi:hypothetical protein